MAVYPVFDQMASKHFRITGICASGGKKILMFYLPARTYWPGTGQTIVSSTWELPCKCF
jgi:hypothetical protein